MKTLFIEAKSKTKINSEKINEISKKLPKSIAIAYSIQFKEIAIKIKEILSKNHKITQILQVLGCSKPKFPSQTQAVLLIGSGRFHGVSLAIESGLPIYILEKNNLVQINQKDIEQIQKNQKASYMKFLNANNAGIIISTKPGQNKLKKVVELKAIINQKHPSKKIYSFLSNNINTSEFENFNTINSWINTACSRLDMNDSRIINADKIIPK